MANAIATNWATTGRFYIVCASSDANYAEVNGEYGDITYNDGTAVVYPTLNAAVLKCRADAGDTILIVPGHTETVASAAAVTVGIANVNIIGLGNGADRPNFNFTTATTATLTVTAANVKFSNCVFTIGFDAVAAMVVVSATDAQFQNCTFFTNNATMGAALGLKAITTADRLVVNNCQFIGPAINSGTTTTAQLEYVSPDMQITNSYFTGKMTQAILNVTTNSLRGIISNNIMVVATGTVAITVASGSTPMIVNNRMNVASGTTPIVAAAGFVAGNIYSAAAGVTSTGQTGSTATVSTL